MSHRGSSGIIWKHLGFRRNIFFVEPLAPNDDDMHLFVGRDLEIKEYLVDIFSDSRSLKIVSGDIGVGKTTFVNACQYFSYKEKLPFDFNFDIPRVLPCFDKIQISETDDIEVLLNKAIIAICQSIAHHCRSNNIEAPRKVKDILSYFLDLEIGTGGSGMSAGISIMGTGIDFGKTRESKTPNIIRNAKIHIQELIELTIKDLEFEGLFIIVNNLDILSKTKLIQLLNTGRDELFDIKSLYWTLIGRKGIGSIIETEAERVAHYLSGGETYIGPLDFEKTKKIIDRRVDCLKEKPQIRCPLTDETIAAFHFLSVQDLRETLRICGEIVKKVILIDPSLEVIPKDKAMKAFNNYAHDRAKDLDLSESKIKILKAVVDRKSCRPKDFELFGYNTIQGFIAALKGLVSKKLLSVEERGRARIYRMTGMTMIAGMTGALGEEIRKEVYAELSKNNLQPVSRSKRFTDAQLEFQLTDQGSD